MAFKKPERMERVIVNVFDDYDMYLECPYCGAKIQMLDIRRKGVYKICSTCGFYVDFGGVALRNKIVPDTGVMEKQLESA